MPVIFDSRTVVCYHAGCEEKATEECTLVEGCFGAVHSFCTEHHKKEYYRGEKCLCNNDA